MSSLSITQMIRLIPINFKTDLNLFPIYHYVDIASNAQLYIYELQNKTVMNIYMSGKQVLIYNLNYKHRVYEITLHSADVKMRNELQF